MDDSFIRGKIAISPEQLKQFLVGKVISSVEFAEDGFDRIGLGISKISFQDGSVVDLTGSADVAYVTDVTTSDGTQIELYKMDIN